MSKYWTQVVLRRLWAVIGAANLAVALDLGITGGIGILFLTWAVIDAIDGGGMR